MTTRYPHGCLRLYAGTLVFLPGPWPNFREIAPPALRDAARRLHRQNPNALRWRRDAETGRTDDVPAIPVRELHLHDRFVRRFDADVLPRLTKLPNSPRTRERHRDAARLCFATLLIAHRVGKVVRDARESGEPGHDRAPAWDALEDAGLCFKTTGSQRSNRRTRYAASPALVTLLGDTDAGLRRIAEPDPPASRDRRVLARKGRPAPQTEYAPVSLRNADKVAVTWGRQSAATLAWVRETEEQVMRLNAAAADHDLRYTPRDGDGRELPPRRLAAAVRSIFNETFDRGGRLYPCCPELWDRAVSHMSIKSDWRPSITIDGEPTIELDFASFHIRMLYHWAKINRREPDLYFTRRVLPELCEDPDGPGFDEARKALKVWTNVAFNASGDGSTARAIDDGTKPYGIDRKGTPESGPTVGDACRRHGIRGKDVLGRIRRAHPDIAERFGSGVGRELQNADGALMRDILTTFLDRGSYALSVHDSIVCKARDAGLARTLMVGKYRDRVGFDPVFKGRACADGSPADA